MKQRIRNLRDLSFLDAALRGLAERREMKLRAISDAQAALAEAESSVASKRDEKGKLQREADAMGLDVRSVEEHIAKLEGQRNAAKSNKEYEVFTREIDAEKKKMSGLEDEVLARLERTDVLTEQEKAARVSVGEATDALEAVREDLAKAEGELSSEEADLGAKRGELASRIDADDLHLYGRIREMRKGPAVSAIEDGSCSACARRLTPQLENLVTIGNDLVQCMSCSRILYGGEGG